MKTKDIKKLNKSELAKNLLKLRKDLFNLRFQKSNAQLTNASKISQTKREISKTMTFLGAGKK